MEHSFDNKKYTVIFNEKTGELTALRYGEPWQDITGNNLIYWMLVEIDALKAQLAKPEPVWKAAAMLEADAQQVAVQPAYVPLTDTEIYTAVLATALLRTGKPPTSLQIARTIEQAVLDKLP